MKRIRAIKLTPEAVVERLADDEVRYGMTSAEFFRRFESGDFDHGELTDDFFKWASLIMYEPSRARVHA
ncbi:MAG: hypothetical protein WEB00_09485 [Dehalococcoidia bacterium]